MRTYEKTHGWLKFSLDLRQAPASLWITLGECQALAEQIAGAPLCPAMAQALEQAALAGGLAGNAALAGNSFSEEDVLAHLRGTLEIPPSRAHLLAELDRLLAARQWVAERAATLRAGKISVDAAAIKQLNRLVLGPDSPATPGEFRTAELTLPYPAAPAKDCEFLLDKLAEWIGRPSFAGPPGMAAVYGLIRAAAAHLYLQWVRPFGDGNGRTARLVELWILLGAGLPAAAADQLCRHYALTRGDYERRQLPAGSGGGEVEQFLAYAAQGLRDAEKCFLQRIRRAQAETLWAAHVAETLQEKNGDRGPRLKRLALDLTARGAAVPAAELPEISPSLARAYARKAEKTMLRDVQALVESGLAEKSAAGVRARPEVLAAFQPIAAEEIFS